jgi:hypothetical protein
MALRVKLRNEYPFAEMRFEAALTARARAFLTARTSSARTTFPLIARRIR